MIRAITAVLLLSLSVLLCLDGMVFGLRLPDPALGRDSGCFTLLDDVLKTKTAVNYLRWAELLSPILALPVGYLLLVRRNPMAKPHEKTKELAARSGLWDHGLDR